MTNLHRRRSEFGESKKVILRERILNKNTKNIPRKGNAPATLLEPMEFYVSPVLKKCWSKIEIVPPLNANYDIINEVFISTNFNFCDDLVWPQIAKFGIDADIITSASLLKDGRHRWLPSFLGSPKRREEKEELKSYLYEEVVDADWDLVSQRPLYKEIVVGRAVI